MWPGLCIKVPPQLLCVFCEQKTISQSEILVLGGTKTSLVVPTSPSRGFMEASLPEGRQWLLTTPGRKDMGRISASTKIITPEILLPPPNPGGGSAPQVPPSLAWVAPSPSGMVRQSGIGAPCRAQSWRCAGNTPTSHSTSHSQDHTLQECSHSCFLLLNAAAGGGDSGASALRSCNNLRIKALTQEVGQWALGPPQPQGFRVSISHETILNPKLSWWGWGAGHEEDGRRNNVFPHSSYADE